MCLGGGGGSGSGLQVVHRLVFIVVGLGVHVLRDETVNIVIGATLRVRV